MWLSGMGAVLSLFLFSRLAVIVLIVLAAGKHGSDVESWLALIMAGTWL